MEMTKSKERNVPYFAKRFIRLLEGILPLWKKKKSYNVKQEMEIPRLNKF